MIDKDILLDLQRILEKESELRPTEVLVGFTVYPYPFSVAYYEATVTEAIELNTFDLAICGLLAIQEGLSREEIGQILGFQVIDNPEKQMYKDPAEFNILQFALKDLFSYGMVNGGDESFSYCTLTTLGKKYFQKKKKFREKKDQAFQLFFDSLMPEHVQTHLVLKEKLWEARKVSMSTEFIYEDESLVKSHAKIQTPHVYSPDAELMVSFKDLILKKSETYEFDVTCAQILDFHSKKIRWVGINLSEKKVEPYFSEAFQKHPEIFKEKIESEEWMLDKSHSYSNNELIIQGLNYQLSIDKELEGVIQKKSSEALIELKQKSLHSPALSEVRFWSNWDFILDEFVEELWFFINDIPVSILHEILRNISDINDKVSLVFLVLNVVYEPIVEEYSLNCKKVIIKFKDKHIINEVWGVKKGKIKQWYSKKTRLPSRFRNIPREIEVDFMVHQQSEIADFNRYNQRKSVLLVPPLNDLTSQLLSLLTETKEIEDLVKACNKLDYLDRYLTLFTMGLVGPWNETIERALEVVDLVTEELSLKFWEMARNLHISWKKEVKNVALDNINLDVLEEIAVKFGLMISAEGMLNLDQSNATKLRGSESELKTLIKKVNAYQKEVSYIIDTNIFIQIPDILDQIPDKDKPIISAKVLDELDKHKQNKDKQIQFAARKAIRNIKDSLKSDSGRRIEKGFANRKLLPPDFDPKQSDNLILSIALAFKDENPILLTDDHGLQTKASMLDIEYLSSKDLSEISKTV